MICVDAFVLELVVGWICACCGILVVDLVRGGGRLVGDWATNTRCR